jgi:hypothetical membrane protein
MRKPSFNIVAAMALVCIVGVVLFWVILFISQSLKPGYNPIAQSISDLALGPYGWLQNIDSFLLAFVAVSLGLGFYYSMRKGKGLRIVAILFGTMAFGEIIAGIFQVDVIKTPLTAHALLHQVGASITAIAFPVAALMLLPALKADPDWKGLVNYTLVVIVSMLILEIAREVLLATTWLNPWFGLYEKGLLADSLVWVEVMAIRLLGVNYDRHQND